MAVVRYLVEKHRRELSDAQVNLSIAADWIRSLLENERIYSEDPSGVTPMVQKAADTLARLEKEYKAAQRKPEE